MYTSRLKSSFWWKISEENQGVAIMLLITVIGIIFAVVTTMLPVLLLQQFGLGKNQITLLFGSNTVFAMVITLSSGYLSDTKLGRRLIVGIGGFMSALGYFMLSMSQSVILAYVSGLLTMGLTVILPQLFAISRESLINNWKSEDQVVGMTFLRTLFSLGYVVGTMIASILAQIVSIRNAFLMISLFIFGLTVVLIAVIGKANLVAVTKTNDKNGDRLLSIRLDGSTLIAFVAGFFAIILMRGSDNTRSVYLPLVGLQIFQDASIAPLMFGISAGFELVFMGMAGHLARKIGERSTIIIGTLCGAIYFVIMAITTFMPLLYLNQIIYAFFVATLLGVGMSYIQGLFASRIGLSSSLYMNAMQIGALVGLIFPLFVSGVSQMVFFVPAIMCAAAFALLVGVDLFSRASRNSRHIEPL